MKFLFDFFPILLFFIVYKFFGIYAATATAIAATVVQVGVVWLRQRRVEKMHMVTLAIILIFGGATLYLHDPLFIKWKPTVAYWLFALVLLGSHFVGDKVLVERMLGHVMAAPRSVWLRLSLAWILFFVAMGLTNLYVAFNYSEDTWVNFKLFGLMGLTFVFMLGQGLAMARYVISDEEEPAGKG